MYDCNVDGNADSLHIQEIEGLSFIGNQACDLPAETIELQLDKGGYSQTTVLENFVIPLKDQQTILRDGQQKATQADERVNASRCEIEENAHKTICCEEPEEEKDGPK